VASKSRGMLIEDPTVSLADLSAVGVRLRPADSVTIVRELILQVIQGQVPGMPSAHVIRLSRSGLVTVEGPVAAGGRAVSRAATLLESLLAPFDAPPELRASGALRLAVARALGTLDIPPYESLEDFAQALERFSETDARGAIQRLAERWEAATRAASAASDPAAYPPRVDGTRAEGGSDRSVRATALAHRDPASLTISDIRRARRATGVPLFEISTRSRIPVALLRQLEWGYLHNWPAGFYGRTQLIRYARAAGLDEEIVTSTVYPLVEQAARDRAAPEVQDLAVDAAEVRTVPADLELRPDTVDLPLAHVEAAAPMAVSRPSRARPARVAWLLGFAAMLAVLMLPGLQDALDVSWRPALRAPATDLTGTSGGEVAAPAEESAGSPEGVAESTSGSTESIASRTGSVGESTGPIAGRLEPEPGSAGPGADAPAPAARVSREHAAAGTAQPVGGLTEDATAWSPSFATVGSAMFYHAQGERDSALMRADTDSDGALLRITRVVDDKSRNFHARPSPDGTQIAFDSDRDGERGVYVAESDGSNVRRVSGQGFAAVPSWSPDGKTLAFVRAEPDRPRVWNLWLAVLESGDLRRLTSHRYGAPWGASWFPDGRRVAYSHEDRLLVHDLETGRERVFPSPRKGRLVRTPAVSPDGRLVIFQVYRDGAWLLDLEDGSMRKVLADPTAEEYAWSPDGRRVAYHSRRSGEWGVWLMMSR